MEKRIMNANRAYYALLPLLQGQSVLRGKEIKICKTLIRPLATYRAESWTLNKDIAKWLSTFERKVLRSMFGGIKLMKSGESTIMKN